MAEYILYHHGIKGMRWGVRRSKAQLARLTNRKKSEITDDEARDFRREVKYAKKHGMGFDYKIDRVTGETKITGWRNSKNEKIGEEYAKAIMSQETKERTIRTLAGSAVVLAGFGYVSSLLER